MDIIKRFTEIRQRIAYLLRFSFCMLSHVHSFIFIQRSVTIKIVSKHFTETQGLTPLMTSLTGRTLEQDQVHTGVRVGRWVTGEEKTDRYAINRDEWGQRSAGQYTAMRSAMDAERGVGGGEKHKNTRKFVHDFLTDQRGRGV